MPGGTDRIKAIFVEALEHTGAERTSFLNQACAGDAKLRADVDAYLLDDEQAGEFLSRPGSRRSPAADEVTNPAAREGPGTVIGRYKLLELIGEGGFGSVFMAEQTTPVRRFVALKILKLGMDTRQVIARFQAEQQALAMLDHPNIAKVLDAGESTMGRPFFVMELVRGVPITEYCDEHRLSTRLRLELFVIICHALQHAHQNGIIHRDIKPSNILITLNDGKAVPKVIDFGIAKATRTRLTERTQVTEFRQMIGTPAYMSPEQAEIGGQEVDTRSDLYSLGVLLYELLTGTTPFTSKQLLSAGYGEVQRILREVDPPRPSTRLHTLGESLCVIATNRRADPRQLGRLVRGELDWIVMKALEKDRTRRYESAGEFARDVDRHLADQPVQACPPSAAYQARKFLRRHKAGVCTAGTCLAAAAIAISAYVQNIRAERTKTQAALTKAVRAEQDAQERRIEADGRRNQAEQATGRALAAESLANDQVVRLALAQARGSRTSMLPGRRFDSLSALTAVAKMHPSVAVRNQAAGCLTLADFQVRSEWRGPGDGVCFNHDCTMFADQAPGGGDVIISRVPADGAALPPPILRLAYPAHTMHVQFSLDDRLIAIGGKDRHVRVYALDGKLTLDLPGGPANDFTPDGAGIGVAVPGGPLIIYDLSSGAPRREVKINAGHELSFSPDGSKIATWNDAGQPDRKIEILQLGTGESTALPPVTPAPGHVLAVAWHPSGTRLAVGNSDFNIYQWDVTRVNQPVALPTLTGHTSGVGSVQFNHSGNLLASSGASDHSTRLWDAASGEPILRIDGTTRLGFSNDDRLLTMAGLVLGKHVIAAIESGAERRTFIPPPGFNRRSVSFNSDGSVMACSGEHVVRFWNLSNPVLSVAPVDLPIFFDYVRQPVFSADGVQLLARTDRGLSRISITAAADSAATRDSTMVRRLVIDPVQTRILDYQGKADGEIQFSADSRRIALAQWGQLPRVVNLAEPGHDTVLESASRTCMWISISPDQKWVATGKWRADGWPFVTVWDGQTGKQVHDFPIHIEANVAFTPDGKWLITGSSEEYRFWEVGTWKPAHFVTTNIDKVPAEPVFFGSGIAAISPRTRGVRLIDIATGAEIVTLDDLDQEFAVALSPDGGNLVTSCIDGSLRLWDIRRIRQELAEMGLDWPAPPLPPRKAAARIDLSLLNRGP